MQNTLGNFKIIFLWNSSWSTNIFLSTNAVENMIVKTPGLTRAPKLKSSFQTTHSTAIQLQNVVKNMRKWFQKHRTTYCDHQQDIIMHLSCDKNITLTKFVICDRQSIIGRPSEITKRTEKDQNQKTTNIDVKFRPRPDCCQNLSF